ncbi:hypothetical protein SAMN05444141_10271 [Pseudovibrio denitrificans]|uniref:Uncharacterized protein n=1 Tax=Pseudovibrio denitrificans TaxID=258256 RepID=A0A1I6Z4P3_9HYPH|nr:hypothetical protein [Pseudovibrio denitrificans]SFT57686.1 hypothetical protein SAMN05444141_10271 [Pseudovibrio denitrificans]
MKTVLLMFLLSSVGADGEVGASYVEKDSHEECQEGIVALKEILAEPRFKIHYAGCHESTANISEFEHPGAEDEGEKAERFVYLNALQDGKLLVSQAESLSLCEAQLEGSNSWCAISTQKLLP